MLLQTSVDRKVISGVAIHAQDEVERLFGGSAKWTERIGSKEFFKNDRMQTVHS